MSVVIICFDRCETRWCVSCFYVALEFFFTNIHIPMVKTSHITMPYDHLFKTEMQ